MGLHTLPDVNVDAISRPVRHSINVSCIMNINRVVYELTYFSVGLFVGRREADGKRVRSDGKRVRSDVKRVRSDVK